MGICTSKKKCREGRKFYDKNNEDKDYKFVSKTVKFDVENSIVAVEKEKEKSFSLPEDLKPAPPEQVEKPKNNINSEKTINTTNETITNVQSLTKTGTYTDLTPSDNILGNPIENVDIKFGVFEASLDLNGEKFNLKIGKKKKDKKIVFIVEKENSFNSNKYYYKSLLIEILEKKGKFFSGYKDIKDIIKRFVFIKEKSQNNPKDYNIYLERITSNKIKLWFKGITLNGKKEKDKYFVVLDSKIKDDDDEFLISKTSHSNNNFGVLSVISDNIFFDEPDSSIIYSFEKSFGKSKIIKSPNYINFISDYINLVESKNLTYNLIFQSSIDGDDENTFHDLCDNISPIILFIKTRNENIFGGFTTICVNNKKKSKDNKAFVFSINKKKIYKVRENMPAIMNGKYKFTLINFSNGSDVIHIGKKFLNMEYQICEKNNSIYSGMKIDYEINGGKKVFGILELEIYQITYY